MGQLVVRPGTLSLEAPVCPAGSYYRMAHLRVFWLLGFTGNSGCNLDERTLEPQGLGLLELEYSYLTPLRRELTDSSPPQPQKRLIKIAQSRPFKI